MKLLLASGLSAVAPNSFSRQLGVLARAFRGRGHEVTVVGRADNGTTDFAIDTPVSQTPVDVEAWSVAILANVRRVTGSESVILIGYADQFPFLADPEAGKSSYLWYQCSRPQLNPWLANTTLVPLTETTAGFCRAAGYTNVEPVIPHGVDTDIFFPAAKDTALTDEPVLTTVGANSLRKRFDLLLEAFAMVLRMRPSARLVIKTDSATKTGGFDLPSMIDRLNIREHVSIRSEELSEYELAEFYQASDLYIHTAEWEGFGIPVIEAMACGLPVVTQHMQGPGEIVPYPDLLVRGEVEDDGGTILRKISPAAVADRVESLLSNLSDYRRASTLGREAAVALYDIRRVAEQWEALMDQQMNMKMKTRQID